MGWFHRGGAVGGQSFRRASQASTSLLARGSEADRFSGSPSVMRMSSSMRTPMPRYS